MNNTSTLLRACTNMGNRAFKSKTFSVLGTKNNFYGSAVEKYYMGHQGRASASVQSVSMLRKMYSRNFSSEEEKSDDKVNDMHK